jgi:hypothetical protein
MVSLPGGHQVRDTNNSFWTKSKLAHALHVHKRLVEVGDRPYLDSFWSQKPATLTTMEVYDATTTYYFRNLGCTVFAGSLWFTGWGAAS